MAKRQASFICQDCGAVYNRWKGKCEACGGWNTIVEEIGGDNPLNVPTSLRTSRDKGRVFPLEGLQGESKEPPRTPSGIAELDRVTGGGFVRGSVILIGGDPGIGKSTLLMQASAALAQNGSRVVYISGEEAVGQVRMRAERLGLSSAPVELAAQTNVEDIIATLSEGRPPALVVIDSIQTMWTDTAESAPGTVTQVRASAQNLIRFAKTSGTAVILVGHVTKDGQIAGPRVVEHMVDAVVSFEGDNAHHFRIMRSAKNRFGPTDEIGVFEMTGKGLAEVANPSALFLEGRDTAAPGTAVFAGMEGTRPLLVEIQALVAPSALGTPRRAVVGWDPQRLSMVVAVLEAHAGLQARDARHLSQRRRRASRQRAGLRSRRSRRPRLVAVGIASASGRGLFRRDRPLGRDSAGLAGGDADEGGGKTRVLVRRHSQHARRGGRRRSPCRTSDRAHRRPHRRHRLASRATKNPRSRRRMMTNR